MESSMAEPARAGATAPASQLSRLIQRVARLRPWIPLLVAAIVLQAAFTATVRLYVVPQLTPRVHVHFGLQQATDSEYFHQEASLLSAQIRREGWRAITEELGPGLLHIKLLATVYYLTGADNPYAVYVVNVLAAGLTALLLYILGRGLGLPPWPAAGAALLLVSGPMFMFVHSELLREPFIIVAFLTFAIGLSALIRVPDDERRPGRMLRLLGGAVLWTLGFAAVSSFRPYLMLPMLIAVCATFAVRLLLPLATAGQRLDRTQAAVMLASLTALTVGFVVPEMGRVVHYSDRAASAEEVQAVAAPVEEAKRQLRAKIDAFAQQSNPNVADPRSLSHDDIVLPTVCTVKWRPSSFVPATIDRKAEALACAREGHLLFCNAEVMGPRADRRCDGTNFSSFGEVVRHLPAAMLWSVAVPYPNMWLDGFGSNGTGLRRAGYVADGIVSYALLPGLIGVMLNWRRRPDAAALLAGLLGLHLIYGLGVPTQFILARMRLAMYLPLLLLAVVGWRTLVWRPRAA
jgi:hypothetical protein